MDSVFLGHIYKLHRIAWCIISRKVLPKLLAKAQLSSTTSSKFFNTTSRLITRLNLIDLETKLLRTLVLALVPHPFLSCFFKHGFGPVPCYACRELKYQLHHSFADRYHQRISLLSVTKCDLQTQIIPLP